MKRPKRLSASFVRTVKHPGRYGDGRGGHGLSLLVKPTRSGRLSRTWAQRLSLNGKPFNVGLGSYPVVTLAEARDKALANRRAVSKGMDPRGGGIPTFGQAAEKVIVLHAENWKGGRNEAQWRQSLGNYVLPKLGRKRVNEITTGDVMAVLTPIWNEKRVTAQRVRGRIGAVMKWAVAKGYREDNPAGDAIAAALPQTGNRKVHHRAVSHVEVGAALAKVRGASGVWEGRRLCLEFLVLTAARSGEVRGARWSEIDLRNRVWTVPGSKMKTGRPHRVPLSDRALDVLELARELADRSGVVFPSPRGGELNRASLSRLARELQLPGTVHGFRSSFRSWCAEQAVDRQVAESALAHVVKGVEGAYMRSDLLERRRQVLQTWADYVT